MIHYPVSLMLQCGIRDILIIVSNEIYIPLFKTSLIKAKAKISYTVQEAPLGLAHAFILGENFIGDSNVCLMLGDNIFHGEGVKQIIYTANQNMVYGVKVKNPSAYGVMKFKQNSYNYLDYDELVEVVEKPVEFVSEYAVPGIYFFDKYVAKRAKEVKPSARGELEIVDVINSYIKKNEMGYDFLDESTIWFDCGTHDHLLAAGNYVQAVQQRTTQIIGDVNI